MTKLVGLFGGRKKSIRYSAVARGSNLSAYNIARVC